MNKEMQHAETNDLRYVINTSDKDGNTMTIKIRLNDECKNGHQDFAITADIWQKGKPKTDAYWIAGGCCHEEILKVRPSLKLFVDLHLCDYKGIPMYAVENGFYHLREGFNSSKPGDENFKKEFCDYYRITSDQFNTLNTSENTTQYALHIMDLGILTQWEAQANEAIRFLEEKTGNKFLIDSKRTQFNAPTPKQIQEEKSKQASGYYSKEAKEQREKQAAAVLSLKLIEEERLKIEDIKTEYAIKGQVLQIGGKAALDNCIYYSHSKTLAFNWKEYDKISDALIEKIKSEIKLPKGAKIKS
jgi:hypothetical protein